MTTTDRPYSRVYHSILSDDRFEVVRTSPAHLGSWLLLLMAADMAWPEPAFLPPVPSRSLAVLRQAGIVIDCGGGLYRIHGMDAERSKRSAHGKAAADARWMPSNASGNASGNAQSNAQPMLDETRRDETSTSRADARDRDAAAALYERTGRFPAGGITAFLDRLADKHGEARLVAKIDATPMAGERSSVDYLKRVEDALRAEDHAAEKREAADERRRLAEKRAPAPISPAVAQLRAAMLAREQGGDAA